MLSMAQTDLTRFGSIRAVLINSLIVTLAAPVFFISSGDAFERIGSLGKIGPVIVFMVTAFSLNAKTVTTLAARRSSHFRKRLRSIAAGDRTTMWRLIFPVSALTLHQAGAAYTPEQARVTTIHIILVIVVIANWVAIIGTGRLTWPKRLLLGAAATGLIVHAWNGGMPLTDSLLLPVPSLGGVVVAIAIASMLFSRGGR